MEIRTDLALERREIHGNAYIDGVEIIEYSNEDAKTTIIDIINRNGAEALSKPEGKYITVEMSALPDAASLCDGRLEAVCSALKELIPEKGDILAVGLGNPDITSDALGPQFASLMLATRHITKETKEELSLPDMRCVSVITPSVTGKTGIESTEIIASIVKEVKPAAVITVDALAAGSVSRLGNTVQICNTGIEPGSGVGNRRKGINRETLGVPVIAIGVPTVVDALSIARDVLGERDISEEAKEKFEYMMVTPKDTDTLTRNAAKLIALAVNCVLQKELSREEILGLM